jgi:hypothetical protein
MDLTHSSNGSEGTSARRVPITATRILGNRIVRSLKAGMTWTTRESHGWLGRGRIDVSENVRCPHCE